MAPLINFPIDLSRTASILEGIHTELSRVAVALERLAPAPPFLEPSRPATLSDLRRTDPDSIAVIKGELQVFAENNNVVIDSTAFINSIMEYEREVGVAYGQEAINELPWNKAAGGPLFQGVKGHSDQAAGQADAAREKATVKEDRPRRADAEPAPGTASKTR